MLMLDPLLDLDSVYRSVVQLERQLNGEVANTRKSEEAIALAETLVASRTPPGSSRDRQPRENQHQEGLFCHYCKKGNHVIQDCWKLKKKNREGGRKPFAGSVEVNTGDKGNGSSGSPSYSPTSTVSHVEANSTFTGFTNEELFILKSLLQSTSTQPPSSSSQAN
ncbi:unnamed protein product [Linum trigynum]|uniref:Uncharacterized protein n=1 Tax=Linum trigynum TaxID=586398 RepID=A0AAV2DXG3_9ROSI